MQSYNNLLAEVTARLGGRTDLGGRIDRWLNYAFFELLLNPRFSFNELDSFTTFTTLANQSTYELEDVGLNSMNFWFILNIRDNTNQIHIERSHYQVLDRVAMTTGRPVRYYRFHDALTFDPVPDGAFEMQIRFRKRPADLAAGSTFEGLGVEWEEPLVVLAVVKAWEALDQRDKASEQRSLLEPMLGVRQDIPQLESGVDDENTIMPVIDEWRW